MSPNPTANIARGAEVVTADGVDVANGANVDALNAAFFPTTAGSHTFIIRDAGASTTRSITLQAGNVTETPVQNVTVIDPTGARVGYMLFNDHIATAEQGLVTAINTLKGASITDLVLDIRYNGGGYLDIASELAYMIAGPAMTSGKTFEQTVFNDQHPSTDPVTGAPLTPMPFHTTTQGFSVAAGQALPTLNLNRVYVLTSADTCSASESVINGLTGAGVQVVQIGSTTCGKPYGFYPQDNCGTTYFSIQFKGVNAAGFGDYTDGFTPNNSSINAVKLPGCSVAEDFSHALGDPAEARLAAALAYRAGGVTSCPTPNGVGTTAEFKLSANGDAAPSLVKGPWRTNRIYRP